MRDNLIYITNVNLPSTAAQANQILNMQEYLSKRFTLHLIAQNKELEEFEHIKEKRFPKAITHLIPYQSNYFLTELRIFRMFLKIKSQTDKIFTRNVMTAFWMSHFFRSKKLIFEVHNFNESKIWIFLFKRIARRKLQFIAVNKGVENRLVKYGVDKKNITLIPNGFHSSLYNVDTNELKSIKKELGLKEKQKVLLYCGSLGDDRDIDTILKAAEHFKDHHFLFLGGTDEDVKQITSKIDLNNVTFLGFVQNKEVPKYTMLSDILLATYTSRVPTINEMCPTKLIEYMASGIPIVSADFERIRDFTHDKITYYDEESSESMISRINEVFENYDEKVELAQKLKVQSQKYSWENRIMRIATIFRRGW